MQTLLADPHKLSSCLNTHASWALNFPVSYRNFFSKTPTIHPSGAWARLELEVFVWAGSLRLGGRRHVSVPLWFSPTFYLVHECVSWPKRLQNFCLGCHPGPGAGLQQPGECINSADRPSIEVIGLDEVGLLEWCWHSDFEWFSLTCIWNEFKTLSSQQSTANPWVWAACEVYWIFTHPSYSQHGDASGLQYPSGMWKLPPPFCYWLPGQSTHSFAGSAPQETQSWGECEGEPHLSSPKAF